MTTTVRVKARAHGAIVSIRSKGDTTELEIPANTDRDFHLDDGDTLEVTQGAEPKIEEANPRPFEDEAVPGAAENDALIKPFDHDGDGKPGGSKKKPFEDA